MNLNERRRYPRHETQILATIHTKDETIPGTLVNVGKGGFSMVLEKEILPGNELMIELKSLGEYAFKGIVRWSSQDNQEQNIVYLAGVEVKSIIWTDLKGIRFIKWSEFVEKVVSETAGWNWWINDS